VRHEDNNFDLLRLVAAVEVATIHANHYLGTGADLFFLEILPGVPVFFFLSGFLIFPAFKAAGSISRYALRRAARIYPALYLCFGLGVVGLLAVNYLSWRDIGTVDFIAWAVAQLSFFQFYTPDLLRDFGSGTMNGSLWTVSIELQFYVITPILAAAVSRWSNLWLPLLGVLVACNVAFFAFVDMDGTAGKLINVSFVPWLYMFVAGAWLSGRRDLLGWIRSLPLAVPVLLVCGAIFFTRLIGQNVGGNNINPPMFAALAVLVVRLAYAAPTLARQLLRGNDVSYGIYLYHMPVVNFALWYGLKGSWLAVGVALAASLALAAMSWLFLERPCIAAARNVSWVEARRAAN
jgi:peptidoglycan/LPS O-acetylase OafA/YrhL